MSEKKGKPIIMQDKKSATWSKEKKKKVEEIACGSCQKKWKKLTNKKKVCKQCKCGIFFFI